MQYEPVIKRIRHFFNNESQRGKNLIIYQGNPNFSNFLANYDIGVALDHYKEIIIQEETGLELGGINKKSFSLIFPLQELNLIQDNNITLLGHEINSIKDSPLDFGLFLLIGIGTSIEKEIEKLRQLNFISNSIEGFLIRTIPRKFWCRISSDIIKKGFSFEFLGNAIQHLYRQKFGKLIRAIEVFFINSYPDTLDHFIEVSLELITQIKNRWKKKVEEWKKRIDCEYDWGCEICPYQEDCYNIRKVLIEREKLEN